MADAPHHPEEDGRCDADADAAVRPRLDRPAFIVGPGRSGTTLLRCMLDRHRAFAVTPETHFLHYAADPGRLGLPRTAADGELPPAKRPPALEPFWEAWVRSRRFRDLGLHADDVLGRLPEAGADASPRYAELFAALLDAYAAAAGRDRVIEKTPGHVHHLRALLGWFPEARVLLLRRDPRAVVASQLKSPWVTRRTQRPSLRTGVLQGVRSAHLRHYARDWRRIHGELERRWADEPRVRVVPYERLVAEPEAEIRAVLDHLDEAWDPAVLEADAAAAGTLGDAAASDDPAWRAWNREHLARATEAVRPDSLQKWRRDLSAAEVAEVEAVCGVQMREHGYEPDTGPAGRIAGRLRSDARAAGARLERRVRRLPAAAAGRRDFVLNRLVPAAVDRGVPAAWVGHRRIARDTPEAHLAHAARRGTPAALAPTLEVLQPPTVAELPLPEGVAHRRELPADPGWWGYSFRDVPTRRSEATAVLTLRDATVVWYRDDASDGDFVPAVLGQNGRALHLRELVFRPGHAEALHRSGPPARLDRAAWMLERVYHNHSHWLTAHLSKLLLLGDHGLLDRALLPPELTGTMSGSFEHLGIDASALRRYDPSRPLRVAELTLVVHDRFRPDLLRRVAAEFQSVDAGPPKRRIYISRERAGRRRLRGEAELWPLLADAGFEKLFMEEMSFAEQVRAMNQTAVLVAPHGAGLTNMLFCPSGASVVEIADAGFPNPNFYALAAGLGHRYRRLLAEAVDPGSRRRLDLDLRFDPDTLAAVLPEVLRGTPQP